MRHQIKRWGKIERGRIVEVMELWRDERLITRKFRDHGPLYQ